MNKKLQPSMRPSKFYAGGRFGLLIDLRSMSDNNLHGSGLKLINTKDGVNVSIKELHQDRGMLIVTSSCFQMLR